MKIVLNNCEHELPDGATIAALMEKVAPPAPNIAVVVNHRIIGKATWIQQELKDGDRVVMFEMVAGG